MLKEHQYVFQRLNMVADMFLTAIAVLLSHWLRNEVIAPYLLPTLFRLPSNFSDYAWLLYVLPFVMVFFLRANGYYNSQRLKMFFPLLRTAFVSAVETAIAAMVIGFIFTQGHSPQWSADLVVGENVSRSVILILPFVLTVLLALKTWLVRRVLFGLRERGMNWRSLLLVGSGETLRHFIRLVRNHPFWGLKIDGVIDDSGRESKMVDGLEVVGSINGLMTYLEQNPVDEVVFIPARRSLEELTPYFEACEEMGVRTRLSLNFFRPGIAEPVLDTFEGCPIVTYSPTHELNWALMVKSVIDRAGALLLLVILSPLYLAIMAIIKATSQSWSDPVFYGQTRCGLNGKLFTVWKFRSMKVNAEQELEKLRDLNEMEGPVFKIKEDPRITRIGKFLRKTSLDELPQFWNVLMGEMSLVGPRPPLPSEVAQYDRWQRRRLSMKPGITCLWQVSGRNQVSFEEWMRLDLEYIDNWSLLLDIKILLRTVYVVTTGYGAM
ncbi:MAG: sugar transferase [Candidatus Sumerlaeaceae bacterium]|nr:sugar transferase [Candidatus Sumerlaeaceae bacterium]